jgi:hypothetical protein
VHLADFSYIPGTAGETIHQFDQCRWFTRGWTLPELLAPSFVQFLDRDWNNIGTKSSLSKQISVITGIDIDALERRKTFSEFSVGCRMSWAARRRTTRPEDVAYCLLGLFDVNMPLIYGEGGENAFLRLQEEIMRIEEDYTLFVWNIFEGKPQTTGLLAKSPAEFTHMNYANLEKSPIQVFRDKFVATTIFSGRPDGGGFHMTSRGLRVCVPLRQVKEHSHQACLTCTKDSIASLICITLESDGARLKTNMHKDEPQAYFRIGSVDILAVADIGNYDFEYTTIYVRNFFESEIWKQRQKADSDGWRSWQVSVNHHDDDDSLNKSKALSTERAKAMFDLNPSSLESQGPALATSSDASYLSKAHKISTLAHSSVGHDREAQSENTSITTVDSENEHVEEVGLYGTATIYSASVDSDLAPVRDKGYITKLAEELSSAIIACETDSGTLDRISQMLPDLLRAFALKLGHNAPTSMHRDVSYFVHKYRR